jgi:hypothetical protein
MIRDNMDGYIARFERLTRQAGYPFDSAQTLDYFTEGLNNELYRKIYEGNDPLNYQDWKKCALEHQRQWLHIKNRLGRFKMPRPPQNLWGSRNNSQ